MDFLPEAVGNGYTLGVALTLLLGFLIMFLLEKLVHCHHSKKCEDGSCGHGHAYNLAPINLIGDSIHNFIDGLVIAGSYAVNVTQDGCTAISDCYTITITDLPSESRTENILAYPNPVIDNLTIDLGKVYQSLKVSILNIDGQVIYEYKEINAQVLNYELNELSSGTYFITISSDEKYSIVPFNKK